MFLQEVIILNFNRRPDIRRPYVGPYRRKSLILYVEALFVNLAKGTMALAAIIVLLLCLLDGNVWDLPGVRNTRKGWYIILGAIAVTVAIAMFVLHWR